MILWERQGFSVMKGAEGKKIPGQKIQTLVLLDDRYKGSNWYHWRTQLQPIRTFGEITAHIKIFPVHQPYLYQKLSQKATQLRLLGMSYQQIASSLNINRKTAVRACKYARR